MTAITMYHTPQCGTYRNTSVMIRNSGVEPEVIQYLQTSPDRARLPRLIAGAGMPTIDVVRSKAVFADEGDEAVLNNKGQRA